MVSNDGKGRTNNLLAPLPVYKSKRRRELIGKKSRVRKATRPRPLTEPGITKDAILNIGDVSKRVRVCVCEREREREKERPRREGPFGLLERHSQQLD